MALVVIADGDLALSQVLQEQLQSRGHQVLVGCTARDALRLAERYHPDLIVLSTVLPECNVSEFYQRLRSSPSLAQTPVLFFRVHLQIAEDLSEFSHRANTYVRGPSALSEFILRADSLLRRKHQQQPPALPSYLIAGKLVLHTRNMSVQCNGRVIDLTPTEFELLRYLMLHADEACSARRLLQNVWGYPPGTGSTDVVRTHIRNLRHKIEDCPARPVHIRTFRNHGYMVSSNEPSSSFEGPWMTTIAHSLESEPSQCAATAA